MFSMVLMAALTSGSDLPDFGRRGGGCHGGCYGGMAWGGCYGGYGMGYGGGWGGCYGGGYGMGYGGGWGGCYGGYGMGYGGWGRGYGGYTMGGFSPMIGGYAYSPMISNFGTPIAGGYGTQSFYYNPAIANQANQANEATIIVHLPPDATLTIDGQATQSRSARRVFHSPPLERGKTYTYTLRAEMNRDGSFVNTERAIEVRAGQTSEVTLDVGAANRANVSDDNYGEQTAPARSPRTRPANSTPPSRSFPTPPREH